MDREARLIEELLAYPSYFAASKDLKTIPASRLKLQQVMNKITSEIETYDTKMEKMRDFNLFAFIYFQLGDKAEASRFIEKSLFINQKNINALTLKALFAIKSSNVYSCEKLLSEIRKTKEDEKEMLTARAEVAYCYTRFGPKLYSKAEEAFEAVLADLDNKCIDVDENIVAIWKFGLTLVVRRTLNFNNLFEENDFDFTEEKVIRVFRLYKSILHAKQVDTKYKARSMVELGGLLDNPHLKNMNNNKNHDLAELFEYSADYYFKRALKYSSSDRFILERCGRHLRYTWNSRDIDMAISLLQDSLSIKETPFANHHLALALKRKLQIRLCPPKSGPSSGQRYNQPLYSQQRSVELHRDDYGSFISTVDNSMHLGQGQLIGFSQGMVTSYNNYGKVSTHQQSVESTSSSDKYFSNRMVSRFGSMHVSRGSYSDMKYRQTENRLYSNRLNNPNTTRGSSASGLTPRSIRKTGRNTHNQELSKNQLKLKHFIKNPRQIFFLDGADEIEVQTILGHLDKSFQMDENMAALYDKGLTLRQLRRYDEALSVFRQCFGRGNLSLVYQANSYEQAALCLEEKLKNMPDLETDITADMNCNFKHYLNVCIEISYKKLIPLLSDIGQCWSSFKILKSRLMAEDGNIENLKELGELHSKVEQYAEANEFFKKLLEIDDKEKVQEDVIREMVNNYCKLDNYDEAILMVDLMSERVNDAALKSHILVEGGFQAYANGEFEIAKMRLKRAINQECKLKDTLAEDDESSEMFDIFILCSDTAADSAHCIKVGLENIGLYITINFDDLSLFDSKSDGIINVMNNSTHFVVFVDFGSNSRDMGDMKHYIEIIRNICQERNYGKSLFIKRQDSSTIPISYSHEPRVDYEDNFDNTKKGEKLTENQLAWLKQLIKLVTSV